MDKLEHEEGSEESTTSDDGQESEVTETEETGESQDLAGEASDEGDGGTSKEEEWVVPGRYKTKEDAVNALRYFESENSRKANELHRLRQEQRKVTVDPKEETERFAEAVKRNPVEAVRDIVRNETREAKLEAKQVRFESEYNRLKQNKEFQELEPVMSQIASQYEDFLDDESRTDPRLLHMLFYAAKGVKADERAKKAQTTGKAQGERSALKKTKAHVEGASGSKGHVKRKFEDLSLEDMRKELAKGNI